MSSSVSRAITKVFGVTVSLKKEVKLRRAGNEKGKRMRQAVRQNIEERTKKQASPQF